MLVKEQRGPLPGDSDRADNQRVLRYIAKLAINPAITHGIAHEVGSLAPGLLADIVLWPVAMFGAKPKLIVKGGFIVWSAMGDTNASIPTPEPVAYRPMFGAFGGALAATSLTFLSQAAVDAGVPERLRLTKRIAAVRNCRAITKADMIRNDRTPQITVGPETYEVRVDGELATCAPATSLPLTKKFFLM